MTTESRAALEAAADAWPGAHRDHEDTCARGNALCMGARAHLASERSEAVEALERVQAWCREQYLIEPNPEDPDDKVAGAYGSVAGFISHMPEMISIPPTETGT